MASRGFLEAQRRCIAAARNGSTRLDLSKLDLTDIPREITACTKVQSLILLSNALAEFPRELCTLTGLKTLELGRNPLASLPPELTQLNQLERLDLWQTRITKLPDLLADLQSLQELVIGGFSLDDISILAQLRKLDSLFIWRLGDKCQLPALDELSALKRLQLGVMGLREVPAWIFQLDKLTLLSLPQNNLESIPASIRQLTKLEKLDVSTNRALHDLPVEIGTLPALETLDIANSPLTRIPPEMVAQGGPAVLAYLRDQFHNGTFQWVSKLLVVGEGGVGKTSLLKQLRGEEYDPTESTTHGIAIEPLDVPHANQTGVRMQLKTWDFGGQQIYHATHQFFLTNRSLILLVWNARLGHEQGRLYYWLDTLRARAPMSPILLVATHVDERSADLPLSDLRSRYPQIVGQYVVSNKTRDGIDELRDAIRTEAAKLPLMGERWPQTWLDAANTIRALVNEHTHITPQKLWATMRAAGVVDSRHQILAGWLHELGDILFFQDNPELESVVLLDPHWATEAISQVLESRDVIEQRGVFTRQAMNNVWANIDPHLRDYLLRLMEQFDLSYRTEDNRDVSIVVERLSHDAPADMKKRFDARMQQREVRMRFQIDGTLPAGIPTWFIARSHRFTTRTHFRRGALLADGPAEKHLAVVHASPESRSLDLAVRGPAPHGFFTLLRDGLELTLSRFPGLPVTRLMPCPGHAGMPCHHEFKLEYLEKRLEKKKSYDIECPEAAAGDVDDAMVDVRELLFGLTSSTMDDVHRKVEEIVENDRAQQETIQSLAVVVQRNFYQLFRAMQRHEETHCPSLFVLRPEGEKSWTQHLLGQSVELHLVCEQPGEVHLTGESGRYTTKIQADWLGAIAPYLKQMLSILKAATPLLNATLGYAGAKPILEAMFTSEDLALMGALADKLPTIEVDTDHLSLGARHGDETLERAGGATLRLLRGLLDKLDVQHKWGGLQKVLTKEGDYLWLCEKHAARHRM